MKFAVLLCRSKEKCTIFVSGLKRLFSIAMIFVLMTGTISRLGIWINFKINQDFIAEVLCINKEEPITMCYGSCYLTDQLQEQEEKEKQQAPTTQKERSETLFQPHSNDATIAATLFDEGTTQLQKNSHLIPSDYIQQLFRPPQAA